MGKNNFILFGKFVWLCPDWMDLFSRARSSVLMKLFDMN